MRAELDDHALVGAQQTIRIWHGRRIGHRVGDSEATCTRKTENPEEASVETVALSGFLRLPARTEVRPFRLPPPGLPVDGRLPGLSTRSNNRSSTEVVLRSPPGLRSLGRTFGPEGPPAG